MKPVAGRPIASSTTARASFMRRSASPRPRRAELAFAGGHMPGAESLGRRIAMRPAMDEHLDAGLGPGPQLAAGKRIARDRRLAPMIGNDEHGEAARAGPRADQPTSRSISRAKRGPTS